MWLTKSVQYIDTGSGRLLRYRICIGGVEALVDYLNQ